MVADFDAILERIIEILKADEDLSERIDTFRYGELTTIGARNTPNECHVYTPPEMMTTAEQYGRRDNTDRQFTVYVDVKINGFAATPDAAKKDMLELVKIAGDALLENPTLTDSDGENPIAIRMFPRKISEVTEFKGKLVPISIIHLRFQIGSELTITIDTVGDNIPILFAPSGVESVGYAEHLDTFGLLKGYAATIAERKTRYYDIENTRDLFDMLSAVKAAKDKIDFTVIESGIETPYTGYLERVSPGQAYDGTPMITLQFAVL